MTTTPTEAATQLRDALAEVLDAIHAHFVDKVEPAISAAINLRDFEPGRQLIADVDHITAAVDVTRFGKTADTRSMMEFSDDVATAIFGLAGIFPIGAVLEDIDPERLANGERLIAQLRAAGRWSDADDVKVSHERAEIAARYPAIESPS